MNITLLDSPLINGADTGTQSATAPSTTSFDQTAAGGILPDNPVANVLVGPSRTTGCASPTGCAVPAGIDANLASEAYATSSAGDSIVTVLPGAAPGPADVLNVVASGSEATVRCDDTTGILTAGGTSHVDALVVAGTEVPVPGTVSPNTTIVAGLPLLILNEQSCAVSGASNSATCTVNALHAQALMAGEVLDVVLSSSSGTLSDVPLNCGNICDGPVLTSSKKLSELINVNGDANIPDPGDKIRYTIQAINGSDCGIGTNLVVIDRIPAGVTVDESSVKINGSAADPGDFEIAPCESGLNFGSDCTAAQRSDNCLTVQAGTLDPSSTTEVSFEVTIDADNDVCGPNGSGRVCNTALIQVDEISSPTATTRSAFVDCPGESGGGQTGDVLKTTGSGGCSLGTGSSSDAWPVLLVGVVLALRRHRRKR